MIKKVKDDGKSSFSKIIYNSEIVEIFTKVADLLDIKGDNEFRIRAYREAVRTIERLPWQIQNLIEEGRDLTKLPGIGKDLEIKIKEIVKTGGLKQLQRLKKQVPEGLTSLLELPALGPKRVHDLYLQLKIKNKQDLRNKLMQNEVSQLKGFGRKITAQLKKALEQDATKKERIKFKTIEQYLKPLTSWISQDKLVKKVFVAGSYRRKKETIGDIDILAISSDPNQVSRRFTRFPEIKDILSQGETKASVITNPSLQVDLRVVVPKSEGAALFYFTGSKAHNIKIRNIALDKGLKVNEYGVFKGGKRIAGQTEKEIYKLLGLDYIPPELREDKGEVEAALNNNLPHLVKLKDLKGDLQMHTKSSDGTSSFEQMAGRAKKLGREYIAITDHSSFIGITQGLDEKKIIKQVAKIKRFNEKISELHVFAGIEVDIKEDGSLDLPNKILKQLDLVVCAIHSKFNLSLEKQTQRLIKAMENPYCNIIAHPTGRIIQKREPYKLNLEKIFKMAVKNQVLLEINSQPSRLDLNDENIMQAKQVGVKFSLSSDAHSPEELFYLKYGVYQARRGWLEAKDVLNTYSLAAFTQFLKQKKKR